jgi:hypothetical protein
MKAITIKQPWATLLMLGEKKIETRSWATKHRGRLLIHAASAQSPTLIAICQQEPFRSVLARHGITDFAQLRRGVILGTVELVDCLRVELFPPAQPLSSLEEAFGDYTPGRHGWFVKDPQPLILPITYRGKLGLFDVEDALINA